MPPRNTPGTVAQQYARKPHVVSNPADHKDKGKEKETESEKTTTSRKDDSEIMPPPPTPPSKSHIILEPEFGALEESLKTITVTTAQIFRFHADAKRLGLQPCAPRPPRSMTRNLERELARYDQICDTVDASLSRAIAILQRDLTREENRIREEEAEKARAKPKEVSQAADVDVEMSNVPGSLGDSTEKQQQALPSVSVAGTGKVPLRRPSKISLSTLHRNPFPLKLDLSSASLRLGSDEGLNMSALDNLNALTSLGSMGVDGISGLASPVTLAPKSARPMAPGELPPDVLAALASASGVESQNMQISDPSQQVDIDLTLEDDLPIPGDMALLNSGNSADKPIELDFDIQMSDIFGDQRGDGTQQSGAPTDADMEKLFGPETGGTQSTTDANNAASGVDMNILLSSENHGNNGALFASLDPKNSGSGGTTSNSQIGTGDDANNGSGDNAGFDYSLFFNENQEHIDVMRFLAMNNTGGTQEAATGPPSGPSGAT